MVLASALFFPHVPQFPRIILLDTVKSPNRTRIRALRVGETRQKRYLLTEIGPYLPSRLPLNYFSDSLSRLLVNRNVLGKFLRYKQVLFS
jgi:hypothetical protein